MDTISIPKDDRKVHPDKSKDKPATNGPDITTILFFIGQLNAKRAIQKAAAKAVSMVKRQAINAGLVMQELDEAIADSEMEPEAVAAKYARRKQYAEALGNPIQPDLFSLSRRSGIPSFKERGEEAYQAGFARGIMGEFTDEQAYGSEHEHHTDHGNGWNAGQQILRERIGQLQASTEAEEAAKAAKAAAKAEKNGAATKQ